jgi:hypothetical protein
LLCSRYMFRHDVNADCTPARLISGQPEQLPHLVIPPARGREQQVARGLLHFQASSGTVACHCEIGASRRSNLRHSAHLPTIQRPRARAGSGLNGLDELYNVVPAVAEVRAHA